MTTVPPKATKVTPEEMLEAIGAAWTQDFGEPPKQAALALLLAHWALETGRGKSMMNYNVGNIKAPNPGVTHTYFRTWEMLPLATANKYIKASTQEALCRFVSTDPTGKEARVVFMPNHPACRFRAYETLEEGVRDYLFKLKGTFGRAWPHLVAGDPLGFVTALKAARYYTADVGDYLRNVNSLFTEYLALIKSGNMPENLEQIQAALQRLGYNPGPLDGALGPRTREAVKQFQKDFNLKVDGDPGPLTKSALQHELFRRSIKERSG